MKNYFYLQIKRAAKQLPFALTVTALLLLGLLVILSSVLSMFFGSDANHRFYVAITGDIDDTYLRWGLSAIQSVDDSRFSVEVLEMTEESAKTALSEGEISAYVVIPEGFMEGAAVGDIQPITYVTTAGMEGLSSVFKNEITALVTEIVVYSQKGAYGLGNALQDNGLTQNVYTHMTELSLKYVELILNRDRIYQVKELGVSDGLSTPQYYICAVAVMLLMLAGMPFAAIYIKGDYAFCRLLHSRGYSPVKQVLCEYSVHLLTLLLQAGAALLIVGIATRLLSAPAEYYPEDMKTKLLVVAFMVAAWNMMLFELSENLVSGLLIHFFAVIGMCYISGCIYPVYAFPKLLQEITAYLPTGFARSYLATCFTHKAAGESVLGLALYTILFLGVTLLVRFRRTARIRG